MPRNAASLSSLKPSALPLLRRNELRTPPFGVMGWPEPPAHPTQLSPETVQHDCVLPTVSASWCCTYITLNALVWGATSAKHESSIHEQGLSCHSPSMAAAPAGEHLAASTLIWGSDSPSWPSSGCTLLWEPPSPLLVAVPSWKACAAAVSAALASEGMPACFPWAA